MSWPRSLSPLSRLGDPVARLGSHAAVHLEALRESDFQAYQGDPFAATPVSFDLRDDQPATINPSLISVRRDTSGRPTSTRLERPREPLIGRRATRIVPLPPATLREGSNVIADSGMDTGDREAHSNGPGEALEGASRGIDGANDATANPPMHNLQTTPPAAGATQNNELPNMDPGPDAANLHQHDGDGNISPTTSAPQQDAMAVQHAMSYERTAVPNLGYDAMGLQTTGLLPPVELQEFSGDLAPGFGTSFGDGMNTGTLLDNTDGGYDDNSWWVEKQPSRVSGFAKLSFPDGTYYINTYRVMIGRDVDAKRLEAIRKRLKPRSKTTSEGFTGTPGEKADMRDLLSEHGGFYGNHDQVRRELDYHDAQERRRVRRQHKSKRSTDSSSQHLSRNNSISQPGFQFNYQLFDQQGPMFDTQPAVPPHDEPTATITDDDVYRFLPNPDTTATVMLHPPAGSSIKGISRKHMQIQYNFEEEFWEVVILGNNGLYINDEFKSAGQTVPLNDGDNFLVGSVTMTFALPQQMDPAFVPEDPKGSAEAGEDDVSVLDDDDAEVVKPKKRRKSSAVADDDTSEDEEDDKAEKTPSTEEKKAKPEKPGVQIERGELPEELKKILPPDMVIPPRKKGPGRPPKDGFMSKREKSLLLKEWKQKQKAKQLGIQPEEDTKGKAGRPRKDSKPDKGTITEKDAKKGSLEEPDVVQSIEPGSAETREGQSTELVSKSPSVAEKTVPAKPLKSPTPEMKESDYTEEQLQRPQHNYVILIHEVLSEAKLKGVNGMNLQQIYSAIERKWPYYKFRVSTNGWQSSVRHNLGQHPAFIRVEKEGKGYIWGVDPNHPVDKERKKRASPPPSQANPYYPPHSSPYPGMAPQAPIHGMPYSPYPPNGFPHPPLPQGMPVPPPFIPPPPPPSLTGGGGSYSSPYARAPAVPPVPPVAPTAAPGQPAPLPLQQAQHPAPPAYPQYPPRPVPSQTQSPAPQPQNPSQGQAPHGPSPLSQSQAPAQGQTQNQPQPPAQLQTQQSQPRPPPPPQVSAAPAQQPPKPVPSPAPRPQVGTTAPAQKSGLPEQIVSSFVRFKQVFIDASDPRNRQNAGEIVDRAIRRLIHPDQVPETTDANELGVYNALKNILNSSGHGGRIGTKTPTPAPAPAASAQRPGPQAAGPPPNQQGASRPASATPLPVPVNSASPAPNGVPTTVLPSQPSTAAPQPPAATSAPSTLPPSTTAAVTSPRKDSASPHPPSTAPVALMSTTTAAAPHPTVQQHRPNGIPQQPRPASPAPPPVEPLTPVAGSPANTPVVNGVAKGVLVGLASGVMNAGVKRGLDEVPASGSGGQVQEDATATGRENEVKRVKVES